MIEQTIEKLKTMRLTAFVSALRSQVQSTNCSALSFEERLSLLVDEEYLARENRRQIKILKQAQLKQASAIEDLDLDTPRNLKRAQLAELAQCLWIKQKHNLIITGPTGIGKTFLACALAHNACRLQFQVRYIKTSQLARELLFAREDGSYPRLAARLAKIDLLLLDEWLRDPLSQELARELLDLIDDRYRKRSTALISQLPVKDWHHHIADPTLADALLDRLVHDSHRLELQGDSMRKRTAQIKQERGDSSLRSD